MEEIKEWISRHSKERTLNHRAGSSDTQPVAWEFWLNFDRYVLFEDNYLLVVNKPAGVLAHFGFSQRIGVEEIVRYKRDQGRLEIVNRLGKDTSGIMALAKNGEVFRELARQFEYKEGAKKEMNIVYIAVLDGCLPQRRVIPLILLPDNRGRVREVFNDEGTADHSDNSIVKKTVTEFEPLAISAKTGEYKTLAAVRVIKHGRLQIIQAANKMGHPVTGSEHSSIHPAGKRSMLHALELIFTHPNTGEQMKVSAPLMSDMQSYIDGLQPWRRVTNSRRYIFKKPD